jgi:N-methylhydantoinase A/oxoprolinase/acetone carboxylase beta subunit
MGGTSADIAFIEGGAPLGVTEGRDRAPAGRRAGRST